MNLKKHFALLTLLFFSVVLSAQVKEKMITISFSKIPLSEAMARIEKTSGYTFFYDATQVNVKQEVSLNVKQVPVSKAVGEMLKGIDLSFEVTSTQIALFPKKSTPAQTGKATTIIGKVVDENGEPIIGANVLVAGTTTGVITDIDGNYKLEAPFGSSLQISYIGYTTQTVKAGQKSIIKMKEDSKTLEEVVVVGYGVMKKKDLTGAVASLKASDLEKEQPKTVQDMLRTGVAGLSVGIETDTKGNTSMMVRGKNNLRATSTDKSSLEPLIVLDGVIYSGQMTDINPNDIEQIDVLKDASSTAVYGAKAANGVVLITTKKGTSSTKPIINFGGTWGLSMVNSLPEVYEGEDFINFRRDVEVSKNPSKAATGYFDNPAHMSNADLANWMGNDKGDPTSIWLTRLEFTNTEVNNYLAGRLVDWRDVIYQDVALRQDYTVSVAGKKDEMSYYSSINYLKNESNVRGGGYSAIRARINLENKIQSFLTYGVNAQFTSRDEGYISSSSGNYTTLSPFGSLYEDDGVTLKQYPTGNNNQSNPLLAPTFQNKRNDIENLNAALYLKITLPLGFSIQTTYSPRFEWTNYLFHKAAASPDSGSQNGRVERTHTKDFYWQWDNMLKWNKTFGKHAFDFTFLANWEKFQRWHDEMTNENFLPTDELGYGGIGFGTSPNVSSDDVYRTGDAFMGRLHYVYDQRYLITATVRRDGYSAFGLANPRATFPAIALGWVFSEEKFLHRPDWFEYGKLRLSWGKNGNRAVGTYAAFMQLAPRKYIYVDPATGSLVTANTFYASTMANPNLKWESTTSWNIGTDLTFLKGRLSANLDVYKKITTDLLVSRELPSLIGYSSVMSNIGEVQNTGVELSLNSTNIRMDKLTWRTSFSLAYNKNKITHLYGIMEDVKDADGNVIGQREADDIKNKRFIGHDIDEIWDYKVVGIWQEEEREEAAKYGQQPGDVHLLDKDMNYKYDNTDKEFQGTTMPRLRWSMRNDFTLFKNFNISFNMYSYIGHKKTLGRFTNDNALLNVTNQIKRDYWTPENRNNEYPRLANKKPAGVSYAIYKNASFLRFDNISIGYTFPKKLIEPLRIQNLNVNATMKNAGYISGWPGYDPENSDANTPRVIYFGINLTL